ncbi:MAG: ferritin-like domain-containing protein [Myxococcota bacterium]
MLRDHPAIIVTRVITRVVRNALQARVGRFRAWPNEALLIDEPLALAEERTSRLRRIYANAGRDLWDGPGVFREAMQKHGGIQLSHEKRVALAYPIVNLMWGELGAWIVAAELAERLEDPDARMAASSQVFDEARHFYVLRDYLAALHVPVPKLDPYFAIAARRLLSTRDLVVKLFAMQILAEGAAVVIFRFLADAKVEPVLCEILPYMERDESRHVGLGVLHLPQELSKLPRRKLLRIRNTTYGIGDLLGAAQLRNARRFRELGAEPRELIRAADKMLFELSEKIGPVPGTDLRFFPVNPTTAPWYDDVLDIVLPRPDREPRLLARAARGVTELGARVLPS